MSAAISVLTAAVLSGADRSTSGSPRGGAIAGRCRVSPGGAFAAFPAGAGSAQREPRDRPSPAVAWDGHGAARRLRAAARVVPRPWTPASGRAKPASRRAGRRSGTAGERTQQIIMYYGSSGRTAAAQRPGKLFGTPQNPLGARRHTCQVGPICESSMRTADEQMRKGRPRLTRRPVSLAGRASRPSC